MKNIEVKSLLYSRLESYRFLSYIFLALPDKDFVTKILNIKLDKFESEEDIEEDVIKGTELIKSYILANRIITLDTVLTELSVDRTQLLRGLSEEGPRPPYESVFLKKNPQDVLGELAEIYAKVNYGLYNEIQESPEQIGMELSFMAELCEKEKYALEVNDNLERKSSNNLQQEFLKNHLGRWALIYADEMKRFARTDFYRGIALLLKGFIISELNNLE